MSEEAGDYFEVEQIRSKRIVAGKPEYFVKWKGFPEADCTWEPLSNLDSCAKMIKRFEQEQQDANRQGSTREPEPARAKSPKPDKGKKPADRKRDDERSPKSHHDHSKTAPKSSEIVKHQKSHIESEQANEEPTRFEVRKRGTFDGETVFKVFDTHTGTEAVMTRVELCRKDPLALILFYEGCIQQQ